MLKSFDCINNFIFLQSISNSIAISITYSTAINLINTNSIVNGQYYKITDNYTINKFARLLSEFIDSEYNNVFNIRRINLASGVGYGNIKFIYPLPAFLEGTNTLQLDASVDTVTSEERTKQIMINIPQINSSITGTIPVPSLNISSK